MCFLFLLLIHPPSTLSSTIPNPPFSNISIPSHPFVTSGPCFLLSLRLYVEYGGTLSLINPFLSSGLPSPFHHLSSVPIGLRTHPPWLVQRHSPLTSPSFRLITSPAPSLIVIIRHYQAMLEKKKSYIKLSSYLIIPISLHLVFSPSLNVAPFPCYMYIYGE
ncbi:hypothetical protein PM082_006391 [Marasmius tenuissimus]|nr:hypothetical protein PM082_006391 [Marasmius tenuissimus]